MKELEQLTWKDDLSDTEEGDLEETKFELGTMIETELDRIEELPETEQEP